jgi:pimeloyl-ACP methyl ester carboxylesterase
VAHTYISKEAEMRSIVILGILMSVAPLASAAASTHREEEVTFSSGTITLAGTLSIPAGSGPFPAVVLLTGSGPQDRDSEVLGFRPFKVIADHLTGRGIAVLRFDDRGVGGSSGSIVNSTTEEFADDALAAIRVLRQREEIGRSPIGLIGHSEGAIVAAIAASKSADVAFIVWMAGSSVAGEQILQTQAAGLARAAGASEEAVNDILGKHAALLAAIKEESPDDTLLALSRKLVASQLAAIPESQRPFLGDAAASERATKQILAGLQSRWIRFFIGFDPSTALRRVACPVFAVFGGRDLQVPEVPNRGRLEAALTEARNTDVTVKVYPEANHLFMTAITGQPAEYAKLPKVFVPTLLDDITSWIAPHTKVR